MFTLANLEIIFKGTIFSIIVYLAILLAIKLRPIIKAIMDFTEKWIIRQLRLAWQDVKALFNWCYRTFGLSNICLVKRLHKVLGTQVEKHMPESDDVSKYI